MIKLNYFSKALIIIQCQDRSNPYVTGNMGSYNETEMNFFNLPNYTMVYDDSRLSKHGGLITYIHNSLSARILHRAPPPRLQVDQNFLTQKIIADPKMRCHQKSFGIWRVTEAILGQKTCFFFKKLILEKNLNKSHYFFNF